MGNPFDLIRFSRLDKGSRGSLPTERVETVVADFAAAAIG
jgi:hypothetical protein